METWEVVLGRKGAKGRVRMNEGVHAHMSVYMSDCTHMLHTYVCVYMCVTVYEKVIVMCVCARVYEYV